MALFGDWAATRSALDCEAVLLAAGVPCARYRNVGETLGDTQLAHRGALTSVRDGGGSFIVPNPPFRMPGLAIGAGDWVAELGENTEAVLDRYAKDA